MSGRARGKRSDNEEEEEEEEERMVEREEEAGEEEEILYINKRRCEVRETAEMTLKRGEEEERGREVEDESVENGCLSSDPNSRRRKCDVITSVVADPRFQMSNTASTDV